jgi:predicted HicB family RNase H-like nuclease
MNTFKRKRPGRPKGEFKESMTFRVKTETAELIREESERKNMSIGDFIEECVEICVLLPD